MSKDLVHRVGKTQFNFLLYLSEGELLSTDFMHTDLRRFPQLFSSCFLPGV